MVEIEIGESPSYEEIIERFGEETNMIEAIEKTLSLQREHPDLIAIGSILGSEQIYGARNSRNTSRGLDFVADPDTILNLNEEYEESWGYNGSFVFADKNQENEWMVAVIPYNRTVFTDPDIEPFFVDPNSVLEPEIVDTEVGEIRAVSPELCYASKMRRYEMQKKNRDSFKKADLVDLANISLESEENAIIDHETAGRMIENYIGYIPNEKEVSHDIIECVEDSELSFDSYDFEGSLRETKEILEQSY